MNKVPVHMWELYSLFNYSEPSVVKAIGKLNSFSVQN